MILENIKSGSVEVMGENTSKTSTLNLAKAAKVQYILTKALYSDAESAVIVELSNNGVDAIIDSGKDPLLYPVVVTLSTYGYKHTLSIRDEGTGMTKEFFENFFMSLLDSTKEESDQFIGAWGLGGKSWCSLKKSVTFTIIKDGIKCKYLCWEGEEAIDYDLLLEEPTGENNGVLFEMPIDHWEYDRYKKKAKEKLAYYDTVILIIDGQVWDNKIYRNELFQYTLNPPFKEMHMCLKDVVYNIDFNKLGISSIPIPIAIRIGLGEGISPTPSRESIMYNKESIALLKKKVGEIAKFFKDKWDDKVKDPVSFYDNYFNINTAEKNIELVDKTFNVASLQEHSGNFNDFTCEGMTLKGATWYKTNFHSLIGFLRVKAEYTSSEIWKTKRAYSNLPVRYMSKQKVYLVDEDLRGNIKEYVKEVSGRGNVYVSLGEPRNLIWYRRNLLGKAPKNEWRALIAEYQGVEKQIVKDFCIDLRGVETTKKFEDWLEARKEYAKTHKIAYGNYKILNKQEGEVTIGYARPTKVGSSFTFEKNTYKVADLSNTSHLVIVFDDIDREEAKKIAGVVVKQRVAIIGQREFGKIKHLHQFKYYKDMIEEGSKPFRRIATGILAYKTLLRYTCILGRKSEVVANCLQHIKEDVDFLNKYSKTNYNPTSDGVESAILEVAKELSLWDGEVKPIIDKIDKAIDTFSFLQYIEAPSWEPSRKAEIVKLIHQMLLFRKKYGDLEHYDLVYNPPVVELPELLEELAGGELQEEEI